MTLFGHHRARVVLFGLALVASSCAAEVAPSLAPSPAQTVEYGHFPPLPTDALPSVVTETCSTCWTR